MKLSRHLVSLCLAPAVLGAGASLQDDGVIAPPPDFASISPDSLRGHLSFIASDLLEGRDTPSRGLDIAAEYIAAQFRRAGLEAIGDDEYFQTATMQADDPATAEFSGMVTLNGETFEIPASQISVMAARSDVEIDGAMPVRLAFPIGAMDVLFEDPIVIVTSFPSPQTLPRDEMREFFQTFNEFMQKAKELNAAAILNLDPATETGSGPGEVGRYGRIASLPIFTIHGRDLAGKLGCDAEDALVDQVGDEDDRVDLHYKLPAKREVAVRNVIGLLRGSDPALADTHILVTAHYDHLGRGAPVDGDDIYNGANDDGSGTVSVIELASAFARLPERPRRSIIVMCFYGEERGLLGSRHYIDSPIVPLEQTIANINLEHLGRTDDTDGESIARLMPTGYDYSTVIEPFIDAGAAMGVEVFHHPRNSASFFARSDNVAFAAAGIPAHTFCTAFIFPDYHGAGDHWNRIDFDNMALVNRALALGILKLANDENEPRWNEDHRATERYVRAWKRLHGVTEEPEDEEDDGG